VTGHQGWLCLGGAEIVNQERVSTYAQTLGCGGATIKDCDSCGPQMAVALEDPNGVYTDPVTDEAPWYSATEPDSADFAGFYALDVSELAPGRIVRTMTPRATGRGVFLGPETWEAPQVVVTGVLLGKTPCAVAYGFRWLTMSLRGSACADGCDGEDLSYLNCCPTWADGGDPVDEIEPHLRMLKGVKVIASPRITQKFGDSCACHESASMLQVTFTLAATEPCVFRPPVEVVSDVVFDIENPEPCVTWVPIGEGDECPADDDPCAGPPDCLVDPSCPPPAAPPSAPVPQNPCICTPLQLVKACADIPTGTIPEWAEGVPIIRISSGSADLRQINMVFIPNPFNQAIEDLDPCNACGEVTLSRIPANSQFVMDGTTQTVTVVCPGSGPTDATALLGSTGGALPFRFPEIDCGGMAYAICVTADAITAAADASISVEIAVREC
jgi:hypothetical protein